MVKHCYGKAKTKLEEQQRFLTDKRVVQRVETFRRNYRDTYLSALSRLYDTDDADTQKPALVTEMLRFYDYAVKEGFVLEVDALRYIVAYLSADMIDAEAEPSLYAQLCSHMMEISTLKEADLCGSGSLGETIFVTTIHKAKGLEFDNVIVFDAIDGRIPNFYSRGNPRQLAEDARKFYVAISRAKRRLYVSQCLHRMDYHNMPHEVFLTPFMKPIAKYFKTEKLS